jgi:predicted metal-binding protein
MNMPRRVRQISLEVNETQVAGDLELYRQKALEMGATRAKIIKAGAIPVDDRVALKCQIPRCFGYGTGANCPPNTLKPAELRGLLAQYQWAILFVKEVPPAIIVRDKATIKERVAVYQDVYKIVNEIESMAFHDGHYLAFGLGAGSCRHTFCGQAEDCAAMKGEKCRFSLRSRPSLEAVGIDVFKMVASEGWPIYPIGSSLSPDQVPFGLLTGLVVIR